MSLEQDRLHAALADQYRIERELGVGGMATVYLAEDLRHDRKVAIKVLRPDLAAVVGAERFLAEIKTTANLQHPHILPLHDSGEADGLLFYVMPYVEGETLADRLAREKQLPVEDAVDIARKVLSALHYAHEREIVHRDIKPPNILVSAGEPLVADFGIALAVSQAGNGRMTETGISLGTPHYMSPEQASGDHEVDPRSDVYAVGCVLFEMLAGQPPFAAPTAQAVLMKVLTEEAPSISDSRKAVPPNVGAAVTRALERLPADRFGSAQEFSTALVDSGFRHGPAGAPGGAAAHPTKTVIAVSATAIVMAGLALWGWVRSPSVIQTAPVSRLTAVLPVEHRLAVARGRTFPLAVSHDGRSIAYVGEGDAGTALYVRHLDEFTETILDGTEGARHPFFSFDDQQIAFFVGRSLYRVRVTGGTPIRIAELADVPTGGAWGRSDQIVVGTPSGFWRAAIDAGAPEQIPMEVSGSVSWPSFLPEEAGGGDKEWVLVRVGPDLYAVSPADGETRQLGIDATGHALYTNGAIVSTRITGVAEATPFDLATLEVTGPSISVLDNVFRPNMTSAVLLTISSTGTLIYVAGADVRELVLVDRTGRQTPTGIEAGDYRFPQLSPDGRRLAVNERRVGLHVFDLASGRRQSYRDHFIGVWSPSGEELAVSRAGMFMRQPLAPGSTPLPIVDGDLTGLYPWQWTADGVLLIDRIQPNTLDAGGLYRTLIDGDGAIDTLLESPAGEFTGRRSPDGSWLVYSSDSSGREEVYVRPYPDGETRQVSVDGGSNPMWSRDGNELFYLNGEQAYAVSMVGLGSATAFDPEPLFRGSYVTMLGPPWDVRPQGDFIMMWAGPSFLREIQVVQNWGSTLPGLFTSGSN